MFQKLIFHSLCIAYLCVCSLSCAKNEERSDVRKVFIDKTRKGFTLIRNGKPFLIKGACGNGYLNELAAAGGNTIRTYDTTNLDNIIRDAEANNIAVIVGIDLPHSYDLGFYSDKNRTAGKINEVKYLLDKYKSSPSVLMWCLGNELYFPITPRYRKFNNFYNELVDLIHEMDPDHPVMTTVINFDFKNLLTIKYLTDVDLIGYNVFFGKQIEVNSKIKRYAAFFNVPYIISEWGNDGPWKSDGRTAWNVATELDDRAKCDHLAYSYVNYLDKPEKSSLGSMVFFWGNKQEGTDTWFSIFGRNGERTQMFYTLKSLWTKDESYYKYANRLLLVNKILIEGRYAIDTLIYTPNKVLRASTISNINGAAGKYEFNWAIYPEDWYTRLRNMHNQNHLDSIPGLFSSVSLDSVTFRTPPVEGPYRLFLKVTDSVNNMTSMNIPFYVVNNK